MSTAGGLHNSLTSGREIGCEAVQLFTSNPRQWQAAPLSDEVIAKFHAVRGDTGIGFTVAHDSYLINLAAPDSFILERSRAAFRAELDRAEALGIPWVVTHMGASMGSEEDAAISLLCESLTAILRETEGMSAGIALETTAGQGTGLGVTFEQIARVVDGCAAHPRLGVCLDTCHIFAAGYDIRDEESYEKTFDTFDRVIGLNRLKVIHANDSKKPLGSRVDRHEHIGEGEIGIEAFRRLVADPRLLHVPMVIETPELEKMHHVNLGRLRELARGRSSGVKVVVRMFGHYRDVAGDSRDVSLTDGATVRQLADQLVEGESRLALLTTHCRAAVNEEYVPADTVLKDGDEVAFIPPMSGG
jgi:apurinic endonuclease (APN1)